MPSPRLVEATDEQLLRELASRGYSVVASKRPIIAIDPDAVWSCKPVAGINSRCQQCAGESFWTKQG